MSNVRFSIIVPVYNKEPYLEKCLNSFRQQTFQNFEVICVDDASTDNSFEILKRFADTDGRFITLKNEKNLEVSKTRNKGIQNATGEWLLFVDADDFLKENALDLLNDTIENKQGIDCVLFNGRMIDSNGFEANDFFSPAFLGNIPNNEVVTPIEYDNLLTFVNAAVSCIKRDFLIERKILFCPDMKHEDWDFMWHLFSFNPKTVYLNERLYFYQMAPDGYTQSIKTLFKVFDLFTAFEHGKKYFMENKIWNDVEYSAIMVSLRHFYDFLTIKVLPSNDINLKLNYTKRLNSFLNDIPEALFVSIEENNMLFADKKCIRTIRNSNINWIYHKIFIKSDKKRKKYLDKFHKNLREFRKPFKYIMSWIKSPFEVLLYLIKYFCRHLSLKIRNSGKE